MFFIFLTFLSALIIEGLSSLVSVIGITKLFGANLIIIALAIALDVGKITVVSLLYTHWKTLSKLMKAYALLAAMVTMVITSTGAAGYFSDAFQHAIVGTKEGELKVNVLKEQQAKYQLRKKQIDDQIAALPQKTTVNQRLRLMHGFQAEQKELDAKITKIDKELPDLQVKQIGTEAKAGPILYVAKAFNITVEEAVKWVILTIIFVFDPLAVFLIIAGNFLWARRKIERGSHSVTSHEPVVQSTTMTEHHSPTPVVIEEPVSHPIESEYTRYEAQTPSSETIVTPSSNMSEHYGESTMVEPSPVIEEPEEILASKELELPQEPITNQRTYVPTGLLKPIEVESPDVDENDFDTHNFTPLTIKQKPELLEDNDASIHREEITRSSLDLTPADPNTVVDAQRDSGFRKATALVTTSSKR